MKMKNWFWILLVFIFVTLILCQQNTISAPIYSIYLDEQPTQRYSQIIQQKKQQLNSFIDFLYGIKRFKYSIYLTKILFVVLPDKFIRYYLGGQFYDQCFGIAKYSGREIYEIVAYNYMYEIGSVRNFCTSIAFSQFFQTNNQQNQNLSLLARNLDYGFQQFLTKNTIQINFYQSKLDGGRKQNLIFTKITHAGFVGSHTIFKYKGVNSIKYALSLNQRQSDHLIQTWLRILTQKCESVFQLLNRILQQGSHNTEALINSLSEANTCSRAYFTIHTQNGNNIMIQKNSGKGINKVYLQKAYDQKFKNRIFYILQTNTDLNKPDPDGRRDIANSRLQTLIKQKEYLQKDDLKNVLLQPPNFNDKTLMTAIIDIENESIQTLIWQPHQSN